MIKAIGTFVCCFYSLCLAIGQPFSVHFQARTIVPVENIHEFVQAPLSSQNIADGQAFLFLQFYQLPDAEGQRLLAQAGIQLLAYFKQNTYLVSFSQRLNRQLLVPLGVRSVFPMENWMKMSTSLVDETTSELKLDAKFMEGLGREWVISQLEQLGISIRSKTNSGTFIALTIATKDLQLLASQAYIEYLAPSSRKEAEDQQAIALHRVNNLQALHPNATRYDGTDVRIAVGDDGIVGPHIDLQNRLNLDNVYTNDGTHGDMVTGILAGAGNLNPLRRGIAPKAEVYLMPVFQAVTKAQELHNDFDVIITNTSYSDGCNTGYTSFAQLADQQCRQTPTLTHVFSAGNRGFADCGYGAGSGWGTITGGVKQGKNVFAVGNIDVNGVLMGNSSRGPATDGRLKPDLVAMGEGQTSTAENNAFQAATGTSAAAPTVAGITALLYHAHRKLNGNSNPEGALVKACLLNTAQDMGNIGPDFRYGWGRADARKAVAVLEENRYLRQTLSQGQNFTLNFPVPPNLKELRLMLYWTDREASPAAAQALVNDLDLSIMGLADSLFLPLVLDHRPDPVLLDLPAIPTVDTLNNVEQIRLFDPAPGAYDLLVSATSVPMGTQPFYLVFEYLYDDISLTYPLGGEGFVPGETEKIHWDAYGDSEPFVLFYSLDGGISRSTIDTVVGDLRYYDWLVPDTLTSDAKIYIEKLNGISDENTFPFSIIGIPDSLEVVAVCPDSLTLEWEAVNGASAYEVYLLGDRFMDSIGRTTTTTYSITGLYPPDVNWFAVAAVGPTGLLGRRTVAVKRTGGLLNCVLENDVQLTKIMSPLPRVYSNCYNYNLPISVEITNSGTQSQNGITVAYQYGNGPVVTENLTTSLAAGDTVLHTFAGSLLLNGVGDMQLTAWVDLPTDAARFNDTTAFDLAIVDSPQFTLPYATDFQAQNLCNNTVLCEAGICPLLAGWINQPNGVSDAIDWRVQRGPTETTLTGPSRAHRPDAVVGKYLYLEASGACAFKEALLMSPCFDLTNAVAPEVSFWLHTYGADMGSLYMDVFNGSDWQLDVFPFLINGSGNIWVNRRIDLSAFAGQVIQLRFRGRTADGPFGDLAIDDFVFYDKAAPPVVDFTAAADRVCPATAVQFEDISSNYPIAWQWEFSPSTVTFLDGTTANTQHPIVAFEAAGNYTVSLVATNGNGAATAFKVDFISVTDGAMLNLFEGFENSLFPPSDWSIENTDLKTTWQQINVNGPYGNTTKAAFVNNHAYMGFGAEDAFLVPPLDLRTVTAPFLTFDIAYVRYSANFYDGLRIEASLDCGLSFTEVIYEKESAALATALDSEQTWVPANGHDWRQDTVDLSMFAGERLALRFVNLNGNGNNLFIDNIRVADPSITSVAAVDSSENKFSIWPNPSDGHFYVVPAKENLLKNTPATLHDSQGRVVWKGGISQKGNVILVEDLAAGIYFLSLEGEVHKVVVF